jgi:predicted Zn-dependent protease
MLSRTGHRCPRAKIRSLTLARARGAVFSVILSSGLGLGIATAGCAESPLGRRQILFYPNDEVTEMGIQAFDKMKQEMPVERDPTETRYLRCVATQLTSVVSGPDLPEHWEVVVFRDDSANAFALPGGKIGVNTGMLNVARTPGELATVIAHEIGHVVANHTNERLSTTSLTEGALQILAGASGPEQQQLMSVLGLGAQVGLLLPFNRTQESEADAIGLQIMARAGFDPRESVALWREMQQASGGEPPEFLSTHPSSEARIQALEAELPRVIPLYEQAVSRGRRANCQPAGG